MQSDIMLLINGFLFQEQTMFHNVDVNSILKEYNAFRFLLEIPGTVLHWVCPNQ